MFVNKDSVSLPQVTPNLPLTWPVIRTGKKRSMKLSSECPLFAWFNKIGVLSQLINLLENKVPT